MRAYLHLRILVNLCYNRQLPERDKVLRMLGFSVLGTKRQETGKPEPCVERGEASAVFTIKTAGVR